MLQISDESFKHCNGLGWCSFSGNGWPDTHSARVPSNLVLDAQSVYFVVLAAKILTSEVQKCPKKAPATFLGRTVQHGSPMDSNGFDADRLALHEITWRFGLRIMAGADGNGRVLVPVSGERVREPEKPLVLHGK